MQFHSAAAPSGPTALSREELGRAEQSLLGQFPEAGAVLGSELTPGWGWQSWGVCFAQSTAWLWLSSSARAQGESAATGGLGRSGTGRQHCSQCCSSGNTKFLIVQTIMAKIPLLVSWCRGQEQTHSWEVQWLNCPMTADVQQCYWFVLFLKSC